jgi:4-oxalocrotonate tautomerase
MPITRASLRREKPLACRRAIFDGRYQPMPETLNDRFITISEHHAGDFAYDPGLRPQDVPINLIEVPPENWSFGNGLAPYVKDVRQ